MTALCRTLADTMLSVRDEAGAQVFPTGGTRVLAYPAAHFAVADGSGRLRLRLLQPAHGPRPQRGGARRPAGEALAAVREGALRAAARARGRSA